MARVGATGTAIFASSGAIAASDVSEASNKLSRAQEVIQGFVGGAAVSSSKILVKHPLDTVTVRLQVAKRDGLPTPRREVLFKGLWSGVVPPLVFGIPSGAVFFGVKDFAKARLRDNGAPKYQATLLSVLVAQFPYWLIRNPSEVLKTRAQSGEGDVGFWNATRTALQQEEGGADLFRGYGENIAAAYPADALKFGIYEAITTAGLLGPDRKQVSPLEAAVAGAVATALSQAITTPLDVVRNRAMLSKGQGGARSKAGPLGPAEFASSYFGALSTIARDEGIGALWVGLSPRIGKAVLSGAIQFGSYEISKGKMSEAFASQNRKRE